MFWNICQTITMQYLYICNWFSPSMCNDKSSFHCHVHSCGNGKPLLVQCSTERRSSGILIFFAVVYFSLGQSKKSKHLDDFMPSSYASMTLSTYSKKVFSRHSKNLKWKAEVCMYFLCFILWAQSPALHRHPLLPSLIKSVWGKSASPSPPSWTMRYAMILWNGIFLFFE